MADEGERKKPTEEVPKTFDVPNIEVTEEGAVGGCEDKDGKKNVLMDTLANTWEKIKGKRSKSKSPDPPRDGGHVQGEGSKNIPKSARHSFSPKKVVKSIYNRVVGSPSKNVSGSEEEMALCEVETVAQATPKKHLAPPSEKDLGLATSPSSQGSSEEKMIFHSLSSSDSSAPSGYSTLPDDETDVTSPEELNSPENDKRTPKKSE